MDALLIKNANAMPAPTWNWLKMNDVTIEIPAGLERLNAVTIDAPQRLFAHKTTFESALEALQQKLAPISSRNTASYGSQDNLASTTHTYDQPHKQQQNEQQHRQPLGQQQEQSLEQQHDSLAIPALSQYQQHALQEEVLNNVVSSFETGMGNEASTYLEQLAGSVTTLVVEEGQTETTSIQIKGKENAASALALDVVVGRNANFDLVIELDATEIPEIKTSENDVLSTVIGSRLRLFAGAHSRVNVTAYITGTSTTTVLDDSGYVLDEAARVNVRHVVLGGTFTVTGLAADLRGSSSSIDISTRYLACKNEQRDFNYVIRHHGTKTVSNMNANGVLAGTSHKVLRGTIDLIHGCKGSSGTEQETVLIANEGVVNKTVPTILCDEDDVAGNHGATIGHVRPDQLFYLMSRGISAQHAEELFMRATLEEAAITAPTNTTRSAVGRLANNLEIDMEADLA